MKTCYVAAPFGRKEVRLPSGQSVEVDFDQIYREVIAPAVAEAGLRSLRADDLEGGLWIKSSLASVLGCDVMIADITGNNPNVLYEVGVRHALRRGATILICSPGGFIASYMNFSRILRYQLDENGRLAPGAPEALREMLASALRSSSHRVTSDSPIFELFPDLRVEIPEELIEAHERQAYPRLPERSRGKAASPRRGSARAARDFGEAVRATPNVDPHAHIDALKRYRDASQWDELVSYAERLPAELLKAPEVVQLLALALNRRNERGDQDRAIALMEAFTAETGGDAESYGILGRIFKDRYERCRRAGEVELAEKNLALAIRNYRQGFAKQPHDYYPGVNLVTLLVQRQDEAARNELAEVLPRVRQAVAERLQAGAATFWEFATAMELACVAGDWNEAVSWAERAAAESAATWMIETAARNLRLLAEALPDPRARTEIDRVLDSLDPREEGDGARDA